MPDARFEALGDERFQQLCQSLLTYEFPKLQALTVGQPDGGRDAFLRLDQSQEEFVIFQVKYVRRPDPLTDPAKWIRGIVQKERAKINRLTERGGTEYYLLTNAPGTAHLDKGSVDKANAVLNEELPIDAHCWWRNDLDVRIDKHPELRWSFPDLLTATDVFHELLASGLTEHQERRTNAVRSFLAAQYEVDKSVRFKQVDLQNDLLSLFIDVPSIPRDRVADPVRRRFRVGRLVREVRMEEDPGRANDRRVESVGSAALLLHLGADMAMPRTVVEGAPGQGKSTLAQYLCQVHRMRLLKKRNDLKQIPEASRSAPVRLPFKVDLRDLAAYLSGEAPSKRERESATTTQTQPGSLEQFLAAQVVEASGGIDFSVSDLYAVAKESPLLLVLDGLDEVATIGERRAVVEAVQTAVSRIGEVAGGLQVVVTSRPAAFSNSPGFPPSDYAYLRLVSITPELIKDYTERWSTARRLAPRERAEVTAILDSKLDQPHMRDLARNPMQLAILLSLINTKGESLPDKRTELYRSYMGLFFDREASKNHTVRDHRDLLMALHGYLAWKLQLGAEGGGAGGSISLDDLRKAVGDYLQEGGYERTLVDELFQGLVERIIAIVARRENRFEFEVQPLREYFAARYLYDTAQLSRLGDERPGTLPDRFDVLARNPYWLNVVRFYAGFYSTGEVPSLVDRLEGLYEDPVFQPTGHPRQLTATLLADWCFSLERRSRERAIDLLLDGYGSRHTLTAAEEGEASETQLAVPEGSGKETVVERSWALLEDEDMPSDRSFGIARALRASTSPEQLKDPWLEHALGHSGQGRTLWLRWGSVLGVLPLLDEEQRGVFEPADAEEKRARVQLALQNEELISYIEQREDWTNAAIDAILDGETDVLIFAPIGIFTPFGRLSLLTILAALVGGSRFGPWWESRSTAAFAAWIRRTAKPPADSPLSLVAKALKGLGGATPPRARAFEFQPWIDLVETFREEKGDRWGLGTLCLGVMGSAKAPRKRTPDDDLLDSQVPLLKRVMHARQRGGRMYGEWWSDQLVRASNDFERRLVVSAALSWTGGDAFSTALPHVESILRGLNQSHFQDVVTEVSRLWGMPREPQKLNQRLTNEQIEALSPRCLIAVMVRMGPKERMRIYRRRIRDYSGEEPTVLQASQNQATNLIMSGAGSDDDLRVIRRVYTSIGSVGREFLLNLYAPDMRVQHARAIVEDASSYPLQVLAAAETRMSAEAGKSAPLVGAAARSGGWFTD